MDEWSEHKTETGELYYYNSRTEETSWDKPEILLSAAEKEQQQLDYGTSTHEAHLLCTLTLFLGAPYPHVQRG